MTRTVLLCGHGSRDPAAAPETAHMAALLARHLPRRRVDHAFLQYAEPTLAERLLFHAESGTHDILVLPAMLFAAGHVTVDIPAVLATFARAHPTVQARQARSLTGDPALLDAAQARIEEAAGGTGHGAALLLVVGRGAADEAANATVAAAAASLRERLGFADAAAAFSGVAAPPVEPVLEQAARSYVRIVILPWFLTTGVLVKRLSAQAAEAAVRHPGARFVTAPHLGAHPRVIDALAARAFEADDAAARQAS